MDEPQGEVIHLNTYQLGPKEGTRFEPGKVRPLMKEVLTAKLADFTYSPERASELSREICNELLGRVKGLGFERYKFVAQAVVGEMKGQAVRVASRCLCDDKNDNFASEEVRTPHVYAVVMLFGFYFE